MVAPSPKSGPQTLLIFFCNLFINLFEATQGRNRLYAPRKIDLIEWLNDGLDLNILGPKKFTTQETAKLFAKHA